MFDVELQFFIDNQDALVSQHQGKVLAIKGTEVIGSFDSALNAYIETKKRYKPGTFMIQPCLAGVDAYTVTIATDNF